MKYLCFHRGSLESDTDAPRLIPKNAIKVVPNRGPQTTHIIPSDELQVISDDAPILRICFATEIRRITGRTRWKYQEYQIRFRDLFTWRYVFDHLPNMPLVPDSGSSGRGDKIGYRDNTELDMTTAEYMHGGEAMFGIECDESAVKSESRWSLSTTSILSLETVRAPEKSHAKKKTSTKTSLTSDSVQTMRFKSKQADSSKQSQQPHTYRQPRKQYASYTSAEDAEGEKQRRHKATLEQLEAKASQPQLGTLRHQAWSKLRMLIADGLDAEARECFPEVAEGQEALLLPIEQRKNSFEVSMNTDNRRASGIEDAKAALAQIERWKWKNVVIFVRDGDTPLGQTEWRTMEKPRVLWAPPFI